MPYLQAIATDRKKCVRQLDTNIIKTELKAKDKKLKYFGLPGPDMVDCLTWKEYLQEIIAVEIEDKYIPYMFNTACLHKIEGILTVLYGDIDEIILSGQDKNGIKIDPLLPFNLVNLDYEGPLSTALGAAYSKRLEALRKLVMMQTEKKVESWLLFVTYNISPYRWREEYVEKLFETASKVIDEIRRYNVNIYTSLKQKLNYPYYNTSSLEEKVELLTLALSVVVLNTVLKAGKFEIDLDNSFVVTYEGGFNAKMCHIALRLIRCEVLDTPTQYSQICELITKKTFKLEKHNSELSLKPILG